MLVIPLETKDFSELFAQNCPSSSFVMPSFDDSSNRMISHVSTHPFDATVTHRPDSFNPIKGHGDNCWKVSTLKDYK